MPVKKAEARVANISAFDPNTIPMSATMIVIGPPASGKCFGAGTKVLCYDRTLKKVEDVANGDLLMGDDETPRKVEGVVKGKDRLFRITNLVDGTSHVVNSSHVLCLRRFSKPEISVILESRCDPEVVRPRLWLVSWFAGGVEKEELFPSKEEAESYVAAFSKLHPHGIENILEISVEEYLLKFCPNTEGKIDREAIAGLEGFGLYRKSLFGGEDVDANFPTGQAVCQKILEGAPSAEIMKIFHEVLRASFSDRIRFLHEIVKTSGGANLHDQTGLTSIPLPRDFSEDDLTFVKLFLRSLGFSPEDELYRSHGESKIFFKYSSPSFQVDDFTIEPAIGHPGVELGEDGHTVGEYYGFSIDGNSRFLLGDLTVTHNTTLMENFSFYLKHRYPVAKVMIGTDDSFKHFCNIFHPLFVSNYWSEEEEIRHVRRQRTMELENGRGYAGNYSVNLLDDLSDGVGIYRSKIMRGLFKLGSQHWAQLCMVGTQYSIDFPIDIRRSVSYVALGREPEEMERKKLYGNFGGLCGSFNDFCKMMDALTGNHTFMIIKKRSQTNEREDCVFWFQTQQLGPWLFGCQEYRSWAQERYNKNYVEQIPM